MLISTLVLAMLIAFAELALNVGNLTMVKNELQNAADAAALAGAPCLSRRTDCSNMTLSLPDWITSSTRAKNFVPNNKVQGETLGASATTVKSGYWKMDDATTGLQPTTITPGTYDYAAVQVTVQKPVNLFFGITQTTMSATATAVISHPAVLNPFPLVLGKCLYDKYWDATTNSPKLATEVNPPGFELPQIVGEPYFFKATSSYKVGPCEAGQWSSLLVDSNSSSYISNMITSGSPQSIALNDLLWVQPGSKNALYGVVNACSAAGNKTCEYVMMPIIQDISTHSDQPVVAFACVHVLDAFGGSNKYVRFQMSADAVKCQTNGSGVGPNFGVSTPPRLVQ